MTNQEFLNCVLLSFRKFLETHSRSNQKLLILHGLIAKDISEKLGEKYQVKSLGFEESKESKIEGRYLNKNVDITILKDDKPVAGIGVKFDSMNWDSTNQKRNIFKIELEKNNNIYTFDFGSSVYNSCKPSNEFDMLDENSSIELYSGFGYRFKDKLELTASINFNMTKKEMLELNEDVINKVVKEYSEIFDKNAVEYNINRKYKPTEINYKHSSKENLKERILKTISEKIKGLKSISSYLNNEQKEIIEEPRLYDIITCLTKYDPGTFEDFCSEFGYDEDSRKAYKTYTAVKEEYTDMCSLFNNEELELLSLIN